MLTLIRVTAVLTLAWIVYFACRQASPRLRVILWRAAAVGLLLVSVVGGLRMGWNLPVLPPTSANERDPSSDSGFTRAEASGVKAAAAGQKPASIKRLVGAESQRPQAPEEPSTPAPAILSVEPTANDRGVSEAKMGLASSLLVLWSVGVAVLVGSWGLGVFKLAALFRGASPVPDRIADQARKIASDLGYAGRVDVRHTHRVESPCNVGVWTPRVLIPSRQCEPSERAELRASLAHELTHCQRQDLRWNHLLMLLQALLWFHPLAWRIRLAHADACEEVSDTTAARYLGDQDRYGRLLAAIALRVAGHQPASALAMARRSAVRARIEAIGRNASLAEPGRWTLRSFVACFASISLLLGAVTLSRSVADDEPGADDLDELKALHKAAVATHEGVRTAHIRFRSTRLSGPFRSGLTPAACAAVFAKHDLASSSDDYKGLMAELLDLEQLSAKRRERMTRMPWGEMELHYAKDESGVVRVRETRHRAEGGPDIHVLDDETAIRWYDSNSQMNLTRGESNRYAITQLFHFWRPVMAAEKIRESGAKVGRAGDRLIVEASSSKASVVTTVNATTGFLLSKDLIRPNAFHQSIWSGWKAQPSGFEFPRVIVHLGFADDQLNSLAIKVVDEARFNAPIPDAVFRLGIPAGSTVVDSRGGGRLRAVLINRDVFDAAAWREVDGALDPIERPLTPTEKDAIAKLKAQYVLADDELVKRFGPPYPLERKYLPRLLKPNKYYAQRRGPRYDLLRWENGEIARGHGFVGLAPSVSQLIGQITNHPMTDVEIPTEILSRRIEGDYLYRPDADQQAMADALARILSDELGRPVNLVFHTVERPVYVASGELAINEAIVKRREDRPRIIVNGGDHTGDHGEIIGSGKVPEFLDELAEYLNMKVINETEPSDTAFSWSMRWYDRDSTPQEKRFRLEPARVLDLVEKQTGIRFTKQTAIVRVLRLEQ